MRLSRLRPLWIALAAALLLGSGTAAADSELFHDALRPNGVARSHAQKLADGRACGLKADNTFTDGAAFEACMQARGWSHDPVVRSAAPRPARETWIDPDTGLECHSAGIGQVCVPPHGTVTYTNRYGLPCRRTGLVAVCSNLPLK